MGIMCAMFFVTEGIVNIKRVLFNQVFPVSGM